MANSGVVECYSKPHEIPFAPHSASKPSNIVMDIVQTKYSCLCWLDTSSFIHFVLLFLNNVTTGIHY